MAAIDDVWEHALPRANRPAPPLATIWLDIVRAPSLGVGRVRLNPDAVNRLATSIAVDLAALDSLIEEVGRQQKQARSPALR